MPGEGKEDTRAIARQAVEAEFRKKKKKRYDSSDDEGDAKGRNKKQKKIANKTTDAKKSPRPAIWDLNYRDRAKERREGREVMEQDDSILSSHKTKQAGELSLLDDVLEDEGQGEDQPVRGLDRSMMEKDDDVKEEETSPYVSTRQEALEWLATCHESTLQSSLGRELLPILQRQYLPAPAIEKPSFAGLAVQRSTLLFSTVGHPAMSHPWHVPREEIAGASDINDGMIPKLSAIQDATLLERIQEVLERQKEAEENAAKAASTTTTTTEKPDTQQAKALVEESDEDIFQIDDDDDDEEDSNDNPKSELPPAKERASKDPSEKSRRTFFFNPPPTETAAASDTGTSEAAGPPTVPARLERLSELDGDYDVDFDERVEDEGAKKKKKKRKRKNDGDDSD
eukprot:scaffold3077_cov162-Amphora_coffeaeformis.AAC.22